MLPTGQIYEGRYRKQRRALVIFPFGPVNEAHEPEVAHGTLTEDDLAVKDLEV